MSSYNIFFASDHHFCHSKLYNEFLHEGRFIRHEFANAAEGDEAMIERHNAVVNPNDRVYFLGDVVFHKKNLHLVGRMQGRKVLIKGNHDLLDASDYLQYFDDIRAVHQFKGMVITHIPIHPDCLGRWGFNVHGHLHRHNIYIPDHYTVGNSLRKDKRYFNVSVEQINYTPISLEELRKHSPNV